MSLIKIMVNDIEIDFVKETLSIKKENNALSRDFKVSHSSFPFLIIENGNTKKALGTRDLASVNKIKTIAVSVFEGGKKYTGELQILSYIDGFRKCNLKYATKIIDIVNLKISTFMPVVSVIPAETTPVPFKETSDLVISGYENWETYPLDFIEKGFPDVKWQFPTMKWQNKYGVGLEATDEWFRYQGEINKFDEDVNEFIQNSYTETAFEILDVLNRNVASPQIYLLAPLFYGLQSIGFVAEGDFYSSTFIKRLLFLSSKNNLTKVALTKSPVNVVFSGSPVSVPYGRSYFIKEYTEALSIPAAGTYIVKYSFTLAGPRAYNGYGTYNLKTTTSEDIFRKTVFSVKEVTDASVLIEGTYEITFENPGTLYLKYQTKVDVLPLNYTLNVSKASEKTFYEMHPTIQLGRYLPDWTFGTYLNALQTFFNLEINVDDLTKKMSLTFNEEEIASGEKIILNKSLAITSYEAMPYSAFLLKYANDEDDALWITKDGLEKHTTQTSDFLEKLESKFKFVTNTYTSVLSEGLDSKNGTGLMIYNQEAFPYTSDDFSGQTLTIGGQGGIYEVFWKKTLKFRLNGSVLEMSGPLTEVELNKIINLKRIFVDNQEYIIANIQYSETQQNNFEVKFSLQSVTF
jgi:hypothetical protein